MFYITLKDHFVLIQRLFKFVFFIVFVCSFIPSSISTCLASNKIMEIPDRPEFSIQHGFYESAFNVIVSGSEEGCKIRYTLDCSDPVSSMHAITNNSPATILIDPVSIDGNRGKTPAVILRACVVAPDGSYSESVTHTYIFYTKVGVLSPDNTKPGADWPNATTSSNPQSINYGMDPDVLNDPRYKDLIDDALLDIPSISISTDINNLFSRSMGIYMNASGDGIEWERPSSIELIIPSGKIFENEDGFQINAGIRIRGGASRSGSNPKHAFRFFFRKEYGKGKLNYDLFGSEGVDKFDNVDLRTSQNYSWSFPGHQGEYNVMNRDVFSRDLQRAMGQPYTRSRYYHLYLNGVYWGLYQSQERSEASFAASYFGGVPEDYDVIKAGDGWPAPIEATDGNLNAYQEIWNLLQSGFQNNSNYFKLQGLNPDESINPNFPNLVDVDNIIDYMLIIFYTGNFDCPITIWSENKSPRNFYCIYNRRRKDGFKFFAHDAEHSIRTTSGEHPSTLGLYENRVNLGTLTNNFKMTVSDYKNFHPQWLHFKLSDNNEYKIRFADRVYKHFFKNGCLTPKKTTEIFQARAQEIELAIIAESARWGDTYSGKPRTKDDDWLKAINDIIDNYFPYRTAIVLNQLKAVGLYPGINPPVFINNSTEILPDFISIESGYKLKIGKPGNVNGNIYYTLDGTDPRAEGGTIAETALNGSDSVSIFISNTTVIKARILKGDSWTALNHLTLIVGNNTKDFKLTEIHYHPLDADSVNDDEYEFLEFKNIDIAPIDISLSRFADGIEYTFPTNTVIYPGEFVVLASNMEEFNNRYGFLPFGQYSGKLDNGGEKISLISSANDTIISVTYDDVSPWPDAADGSGVSLVTIDSNPQGDLNDPSNWRVSNELNGSPGRDDSAPTSTENECSYLPDDFALFQNYPNPFNPTSNIKYNISVTSRVTLTVYDVLGREVSVLVNEVKEPGSYEATFNGTNLASGVYLYKLHTDSGVNISKKLLLLK